jgi:hypothetical protein
MNYGLLMQPAITSSPIRITPFCDDPHWAADPNDRRSTSGACVYIGPNLVSWLSKKQALVAKSSTEVEYRSLAQATVEVLWIQSLLKELKFKFLVPLVLCDNLSTVNLSHNPILHAWSKNMVLDIFFC